MLYNIDNCNAQGEYYLPDAIQLLLKAGKKAGAYTADNANAVLGANDCMQLNHLNVIARELILKAAYAKRSGNSLYRWCGDRS